MLWQGLRIFLSLSDPDDIMEYAERYGRCPELLGKRMKALLEDKYLAGTEVEIECLDFETMRIDTNTSKELETGITRRFAYDVAEYLKLISKDIRMECYLVGLQLAEKLLSAHGDKQAAMKLAFEHMFYEINRISSDFEELGFDYDNIRESVIGDIEEWRSMENVFADRLEPINV